MAATFVRNFSEGRVRVAMGRCDAASARWGGPGSREPRQDQQLKRRLALGARLAENVARCPAAEKALASRTELADTAGEGRASEAQVPRTLGDPAALRFWVAVILTGVGVGLGAALLTVLLKEVQGVAWGVYEPSGLTEAARRADPGATSCCSSARASSRPPDSGC